MHRPTDIFISPPDPDDPADYNWTVCGDFDEGSTGDGRTNFDVEDMVAALLPDTPVQFDSDLDIFVAYVTTSEQAEEVAKALVKILGKAKIRRRPLDDPSHPFDPGQDVADLQWEWCVMHPSFPEDPHRGPMSEEAARKWINRVNEDTPRLKGAFYLARRQVGPWTQVKDGQ